MITKQAIVVQACLMLIGCGTPSERRGDSGLLRLKAEAYAHARIALLRENRGLSSDRMAAFDADRVKQLGDVFIVNIPCDAMNIYGKEDVVNTEVQLRFSQGVWIAVTIPQLLGTVRLGPGSLP